MMRRGTGTTTDARAAWWRRVATLLGASSLAIGVSACSTNATAEEHLGIFVGFNQEERLRQIEEDLGRPIDVVVTMADSRSVEAMNSSIYGQFAAPDAYLPGLSERLDVVVSIPLAFGPGGIPLEPDGRAEVQTMLEETASGGHDNDFRLVAEYLVTAGYEDATIRLGHEFDGDWAPYSARGNNEAYIAAFRHVHDVMTAVSPEFQFDWASMVPHFLEYGPDAYPGDDVVDVIGIDAYWRGAEPISDAEWTNRFEPVLRAHLEFAQLHGKPVSYPEWGRSFADHPRFVELMHEWFSQLPTTGAGSLAYQAYFNEVGLTDDEFYPYDLDKLPNVKSRYIDLFGAQ